MKTYKFEFTEGCLRGRVLADTRQQAIKKMKRYVDDMFETKGRQLVKTCDNGECVTFMFCGRDVPFKLNELKD